MDLPEEALISLALEEFGDGQGSGELAKLAKHCQVVITAATISPMAKMLRDVAPQKSSARKAKHHKARPRKARPPKMVQLPNGSFLALEPAVLRVLKNGMSARDVEKEFQKRDWIIDIQHVRKAILPILRTSNLYKCVGTRPERFDWVVNQELATPQETEKLAHEGAACSIDT